MRKKLEQVEATTGKRPHELDHVDMPVAAKEAWELWLDLHSGRTINGMSVTHLSWADIHAWSQLRSRKLTFTQLELVRVIDSAYVVASSKKKDGEK